MARWSSRLFHSERSGAVFGAAVFFVVSARFSGFVPCCLVSWVRPREAKLNANAIPNSENQCLLLRFIANELNWFALRVGLLAALRRAIRDARRCRRRLRSF